MSSVEEYLLTRLLAKKLKDRLTMTSSTSRLLRFPQKFSSSIYKHKNLLVNIFRRLRKNTIYYAYLHYILDIL